MHTGAMRYRSVLGLAPFVKAAIALQLLAATADVSLLATSVALDLPLYDLLGPAFNLVAYGLWIVELGLIIVSAILMLTWLHRASSSAQALGIPLQHSPGMAVGCWFIPCANLWFPLQVVQGLDRAVAPEDPEEIKGNADIMSWWVCWILTGLLGNAASRMSTLDLTTLTAVHGLELLFRLAAGALLIGIITRISHNLERRAQAAGVVPAPPLSF